MDKKDTLCWNRVKWPVTIVADRYHGLYSRGEWLAFPCEPQDIPAAVFGEDNECDEFWKNYEEPVGKGTYADDALEELIYLMKMFNKN